MVVLILAGLSKISIFRISGTHAVLLRDDTPFFLTRRGISDGRRMGKDPLKTRGATTLFPVKIATSSGEIEIPAFTPMSFSYSLGGALESVIIMDNPRPYDLTVDGNRIEKKLARVVVRQGVVTAISAMPGESFDFTLGEERFDLYGYSKSYAPDLGIGSQGGVTLSRIELRGYDFQRIALWDGTEIDLKSNADRKRFNLAITGNNWGLYSWELSAGEADSYLSARGPLFGAGEISLKKINFDLWYRKLLGYREYGEEKDTIIENLDEDKSTLELMVRGILRRGGTEGEEIEKKIREFRDEGLLK